jgi:glycerophosphoryl diester phosphodiesterase
MAAVSGAGRRRPLVIAHRGESTNAPEQTVAAFRLAAELGADMIEADVQRTADGRLVLLHDATVDRTTNGYGPVTAFTFDELQVLDAGSWFSAAFADERIPALDELFDLAQHAELRLCLEVKGASAEEQSSLACAVAAEIASRGRLVLDVLASFDHDALGEAARAVPGLRCAPDRLPERGPSDMRDLVAQAGAVGAHIVQHHHEDLTADVVAEVQACGIDIWAWPANTRPEIERVLDMHVAGVMGNDVSAIVDCVADRVA